MSLFERGRLQVDMHWRPRTGAAHRFAEDLTWGQREFIGCLGRSIRLLPADSELRRTLDRDVLRPGRIPRMIIRNVRRII